MRRIRKTKTRGRKTKTRGRKTKTRGRKTKTRGRKYKYSVRQMRNFAYQSKSEKKQAYWMRRLYKQKEKEAKKKRLYGQVDMYRRLRKNVKETIRKYGVRKTTWKVATTQKDFDTLVLKGKPSKDGTKLLVLDNDKNAILIAYEGDTIFNEILDTQRAIKED